MAHLLTVMNRNQKVWWGDLPPPRENRLQEHAFTFFGFEAVLGKLSLEGKAV